ncbi:structural maintenance of chromosomes protein [Ceratobasidium sp. AG-Ba]|nr:structural maintenance of chromosomes protein [Ceratobasidium sp. AG-Ba]QRW02304.1 structural maintenance of chromosomes protein [Ceratobasidium sp. AG-Ba]
MENTIARYQRRRELEREVELLNLLLPFAQYNESKKAYDELKRQREEVRQMLDAAKEKIQPIERKKEEFAGLVRTADSARKKAAEKPRGAMEKIKRKLEEQEAAEKESDALIQKRQELKTQEKNRKNRITKIKADISRLEKIVEREPDVGDAAGLTEQRNELQRNHRTKMDEYRQLQDEQRQVAEEIGRRKEQAGQAQKGLQALSNVANQRMELLRRGDPDVADVAEWLSKNQGMFREEIIMPAWLSVFVKDRRYQHQVENLFNVPALKTFVCQNEDDYRAMNKAVNDDGIIGRKVRVNIWYRPPSQSQPPVPPENLQNLGFDCYAIERVQAPEGMRNYLEKELGLNRIALATREDANIDAMIEAVTAQGSGTFITGTTMHQVTRSQYGRRLAQTSTRRTSNARLFGGSQVDTERQKQLEQEIVAARAHIDAEEAKMADINARDQPMRAGITELEEKLHEVNKLKLEAAQKNLKKEESAPELKDEEEKLKKRLLKGALKRAILMHELKDLFQKLHDTQVQATTAALRHQQAVANANAVEKLLSNYEQEVQRIQKEFDKIDAEFQSAKSTSKKLLEATKARMSQVSDEMRAEFEENYRTNGDPPPVAQVEAELAEKQGELELNQPANQEAIRQYEVRAAQILVLQRRVETQEKKVNKLASRVERTKNKWKPALEELVSQISKKFSAAFDRIRRAGEIHVRDAGDNYAEWAIDILVKFRETEKLQVLDAHRQSGGERSLSTIMYLLSLTEYARIPFSLVDEINQGMDASAERDVHNQLVEVTCNTDCGQYFLITPKLLTGLHYHEKMKVLCVNNGDWMLHPDPMVPGAGDLMKLINDFAAGNGIAVAG